ncbi:DsbA family protein [Brevundimonas sp.]|uniref:DsbA family protein n=1 Tax=Brevundimonas sp. TaxID=1871086 RepID=UPI00289DBC53|nr:DsbA family protein [Brevundimonas sp.]
MKFVSLGAALAAAIALGACGPADANSQPQSGGGAMIMDVGFNALLRDPATPFLGAEDADVTIIGYMDYNCPYCKMMIPELEGLMASDSKVRVLYKEWPIFGEVSENASRIALAAGYQGKYHEVHKAFMGAPGRIDSDATARRLATEAGADMAQLEADLTAHRSEIDAVIRRNTVEASALALRGTPAFVVNGVLIPGGLKKEQFEALIGRIRSGQPLY